MDDITAFGIAAFSGVIALIGSAIGAGVAISNHAYSERQKEKIEKRNKRAEKLEELISLLRMQFLSNATKLLAEGKELDTETRNNMVLNEGAIEAVMKVYFPDLIDKYDAVCKVMWDFNEGEIPKLRNEYYIRFEEFMRYIADYAKREFK
jgi:hypothetical protein